MICGKNIVFSRLYLFSCASCILFQIVWLLSKVLLKLLDQTKETILITALEKIHRIGESRKWILWQAKDRFYIFGKKCPNQLSKIYTYSDTGFLWFVFSGMWIESYLYFPVFTYQKIQIRESYFGIPISRRGRSEICSKVNNEDTDNVGHISLLVTVFLLLTLIS